MAHRNCMIAAFVASTLFLACYITYHGYLAYYLHRGPTRVHATRPGFGPIYLTILLTHTVLAVVIVPLALITLIRALQAALRSAQEDRPLDLAVLDVRLRDRRADLPAALPDLPAEIGREVTQRRKGAKAQRFLLMLRTTTQGFPCPLASLPLQCKSKESLILSKILRCEFIELLDAGLARCQQGCDDGATMSGEEIAMGAGDLTEQSVARAAGPSDG